MVRSYYSSTKEGGQERLPRRNNFLAKTWRRDVSHRRNMCRNLEERGTDLHIYRDKKRKAVVEGIDDNSK